MEKIAGGPVLGAAGSGVPRSAGAGSNPAHGREAVNVFVNVIDQNGAIVSGLTRDDFALAEDGRPQQIAVFERCRICR